MHVCTHRHVEALHGVRDHVPEGEREEDAAGEGVGHGDELLVLAEALDLHGHEPAHDVEPRQEELEDDFEQGQGHAERRHVPPAVPVRVGPARVAWVWRNSIPRAVSYSRSNETVYQPACSHTAQHSDLLTHRPAGAALSGHPPPRSCWPAASKCPAPACCPLPHQPRPRVPRPPGIGPVCGGSMISNRLIDRLIDGIDWWID